MLKKLKNKLYDLLNWAFAAAFFLNIILWILIIKTIKQVIAIW